MKKTVLVLLCMLFAQTWLKAQGFEKGNFVIDAGLGLGFYDVSDNNPKNSDGGAAAVVVPVGIEYGISNVFGISLYLLPQSYISNQDSANAAQGLNLGLSLNVHVYNGKSSTILAKLGVGGSGFAYQENKPNQEAIDVRGGGTNFFIGLQWRKYFGNHFGIFALADYSFHNIDAIEYNSGPNKGNKLKLADPVEDYAIAIRGLNTQVGLTVKF